MQPRRHVYPEAIQALAATPQDTEITVEKGQVLLIEARGTIEVDGTTYGPAGDALFGGTNYALWNRPINALFGVIGQASFMIGRRAARAGVGRAGALAQHLR